MEYFALFFVHSIVVAEDGHLCVTIECKLQTTFEKAIFFIPVTIILIPTYPNDIPRVYLKKQASMTIIIEKREFTICRLRGKLEMSLYPK